MSETPFLFDISELPVNGAEAQFKGFDTPLWTKNKARFIARYLKTFTYVTKHGTYIDAFAGPQHPDSRDETWAAKLVMDNKPAWLRKFHLFDEEPEQVKHLESLKTTYLAENNDGVKRTVSVTPGDCNITLPAFLIENPVREKEASFCLLDQRSTECAWSTVATVAGHKGASGGNKIELFYFLPQGWIDRTIKSWRNDVEERCKRWWGKEGVMDFLKLSSPERGITMAKRFKEELGYKYSYPFPIQKEGERGCIMFWMIHATDHDRATTLMAQAYRHIGAGGGLADPVDQMEIMY